MAIIQKVLVKYGKVKAIMSRYISYECFNYATSGAITPVLWALVLLCAPAMLLIQ